MRCMRHYPMSWCCFRCNELQANRLRYKCKNICQRKSRHLSCLLYPSERRQQRRRQQGYRQHDNHIGRRPRIAVLSSHFRTSCCGTGSCGSCTYLQKEELKISTLRFNQYSKEKDETARFRPFCLLKLTIQRTCQSTIKS